MLKPFGPILNGFFIWPICLKPLLFVCNCCYGLSKSNAFFNLIVCGIPKRLKAIFHDFKSGTFEPVGQLGGRFTTPSVGPECSRFFPFKAEAFNFFQQTGSATGDTLPMVGEPTKMALDLNTSVIMSFLSVLEMLYSLTVTFYRPV